MVKGTKNMNHKDFFVSVVVLVGVLALFFWIAPISLSRTELAECLQLEEQSKDLDRSGIWFATQIEHDTCVQYNINLRTR